SLEREMPRGRQQQQSRRQSDDTSADAREMLAAPPALDRGKLPRAIDLDEVSYHEDYRPAHRTRTADARPAAGRFRRFFKRTAILLCAILLVWGGSRILLTSRQTPDTKPLKSASAALRSVAQASAALPASVSDMPAVIALQRNDPESFERFKK